MAYASYSDYQVLYGGSLLTQEQFERYAGQAGDYLELLTYGRCAAPLEAVVEQAVHKACCAVTEELYRQEQQPAQLRSHRVGQWSRSYAPGKSREQAIADAARVYLAGTGLLWRGWKREGGA